MSNFVFVLDTNKQPLNPVPPGQARRLLKLKQAAVYRRYPFTIILNYAVPNPEVEPHQLKIDPGSKTTGLAIVQGENVIWGAELSHRGQQKMIWSPVALSGAVDATARPVTVSKDF